MIKLELTIIEKRQMYTACWNERAKLYELIKKREKSGAICRCSTHERIDTLTDVIEKLKQIV